MNCRDTYSARRPCGFTKLRPGVAPIEFAMFLPIYGAFLLLFFWVARVKQAELSAGDFAVRDALAKSAEVLDRDLLNATLQLNEPTAPELRELVDAFDSGVPLFGGLVEGEAVQESGEGILTLLPGLDAAKDKHAWLIHCWEDALFLLPQSSQEQRQLTLPEQIKGIAPGIQQLDQFALLLDFSGTGVGGSTSLNSITRNLNRAIPLINGHSQEIPGELRALDAQIESVMATEPVDYAELDRLRQERDRLQEHLDALREASDHAGEAISRLD